MALQTVTAATLPELFDGAKQPLLIQHDPGTGLIAAIEATAATDTEVIMVNARFCDLTEVLLMPSGEMLPPWPTWRRLLRTSLANGRSVWFVMMELPSAAPVTRKALLAAVLEEVALADNDTPLLTIITDTERDPAFAAGWVHDGGRVLEWVLSTADWMRWSRDGRP